MKLSPTLAAACLCLVAACGQKGGNAIAPAAGPAAGGAPAASGPDVVVGETDMPRLRPGLWRQTIDDGDGKPDVMTICHSGAVTTLPKRSPNCGQFTIKRTFLGAYVVDMNCHTPQFSMVMHSVATGDFQNAVSSDATMTMSGEHVPVRTTKTHTEAHWVGPCPPGQKPIEDEGTGGAAG
jgi:predicted small lipoprotein YifL